MNPEALAEEIARLLQGRVDEYAVLALDGYEVMAKFYPRGISVVQAWRKREASVYLAKDRRVQVSEVNAGDPRRVLEEAVDALGRVEESMLYAPLPQPTGRPIGPVVDGRLREAAVSGDVSGVLEDLELPAEGSAGMVRVAYYRVHLEASNGASMGEEYTLFNGYVRFLRGDASGQWSWTSTRYDLAAAKRAIGAAREAAEECARLPAETPEPGEYRVLLGPMVAANLLGEVVSAANAGMVVFGLSFLANAKPGDVVASSALTLRDRPRDTSLPGFSGFDDEGLETRDKAIIEKGVFKGFLHNTKTARLMQAESTGNAGWIMPKAFNVEVDPGDLKPDEMLETLRDGVYITNNWYTRFQNYLEGTFSTVSRDAVFIVKGGRPAACARRVRIADSLPRLIKNVEALGAQQWPIQWWEVETPTRTPYVLLSKARITRPQ